MKALLINPKEKTVNPVEYDGQYESIKKLLDCDMIEWVGLGSTSNYRIGLYIDEEGMLVDQHPYGYFEPLGFPQPLAGMGLLTVVDSNTGEDIGIDAATHPLHTVHIELFVEGIEWIDTLSQDKLDELRTITVTSMTPEEMMARLGVGD